MNGPGTQHMLRLGPLPLIPDPRSLIPLSFSLGGGLMARQAEATWKGDLKGGSGRVKLGSGAYEGNYSFATRFENGAGANPEELIGAALAGCYSMALANSLAQAGFTATSVHTKADVNLGKDDTGFLINQIDLTVDA